MIPPESLAVHTLTLLDMLEEEYKKQAETSKYNLANQVYSISAKESIEDMADEIAIQLPSPSEVELMAVSTYAKELRHTLLNQVQYATSLEEARRYVSRFYIALTE